MIELHLHVTPVMGDFRGEVPVSELITGQALAAAVGLTAGTAQNNTEPWLHFIDSVDGKTKYIAKKPFRHNLSWSHLESSGVVYGDKMLTIQGNTYRVRLLKGAATDPAVFSHGSNDHSGTWGSEWNRLLYPLVNSPTGVSGEGIRYGSWAKYSIAELILVTGAGNGAGCWCQEQNGASRVRRGAQGVRYAELNVATVATIHTGWRPVLELVN